VKNMSGTNPLGKQAKDYEKIRLQAGLLPRPGSAAAKAEKTRKARK
jgi:hypothetical protein